MPKEIDELHLPAPQEEPFSQRNVIGSMQIGAERNGMPEVLLAGSWVGLDVDVPPAATRSESFFPY